MGPHISKPIFNDYAVVCHFHENFPASNYYSHCLVCVCALCNTVTNGDIVSGPSNVAAAVGTQAYFNCTATGVGASSILLWQRATADSYEDIYVSTSNSVLDPAFSIEVDSTNGHYNLIVNSVSLDLGVRYWCSILGTNHKFYGELVAVGGLFIVTAHIADFAVEPHRRVSKEFWISLYRCMM